MMGKSAKNLISTISAIAVMSECLVIAPVEAALAEDVIYRISCEGTNENGTCSFVYVLKARSNGNIHIEIQGDRYLRSSTDTVGVIGNLVFNDTMIATLGEAGANGTSELSRLAASVNNLESYDETNVIYTPSTSVYCHRVVGQPIASYDLYVKEPYLGTNQTINLFGTEVEIPFGNPPIDKDAVIENLNTEVTRLTDVLTEKDAETDRLTAVLYDYAQKNSALEAENIEFSHAALQYQEEIKGNQEIISDVTDRNNELQKQIVSLGEEILTLQATIQENANQIKMYEDKIAKMSATAEVVMTEGDNIFRCDINGDGLIDAVDASIILTAYAKISTGENIQHISQVVN